MLINSNVRRKNIKPVGAIERARDGRRESAARRRQRDCAGPARPVAGMYIPVGPDLNCMEILCVLNSYIDTKYKYRSFDFLKLAG